MKYLNLIIVVLISLLSNACSTTKYVDNSEFEVNKEYAQVKRPLTSDYHLLVSLLKRPTTVDQIMMQQFAAQQDSYKGLYFVNYVTIKGDKINDPVIETNGQNEQDMKNSYPLNLLDDTSVAYNDDFVKISGPE